MSHMLFDSCNDAFPVSMMMLRDHGVFRSSRNGDVLEYPGPVIFTYRRPWNRVLMSKARRINPFLHFFEPLWILAGRRDVEFLSNIVPRFADYSDDGKTFNAAYGYRLRANGMDQIHETICRLRKNPDDRQCVLQIRHPLDLWYTGKDTACNISIAVKVRDGLLDLHVFNRSNDAIWGGPAGGANYPQFTVLQEYLAEMIGVGMGRYHHTTDSMHVYLTPQWERLKDLTVQACPYEIGEVSAFRMFSGLDDPAVFDFDLTEFFSRRVQGLSYHFRTPYFKNVVDPMWAVFKAYKNGEKPYDQTMMIEASDWRIYIRQWLNNSEAK